MKKTLRLMAGILCLCCVLGSFAGCDLIDYYFGTGDTTPEGEGDTPAASAGLYINEICSKNTSYPSPDGKNYDWIELYNSSENALWLNGYAITDKEGKMKHTFSQDLSVPAGGYLLLWACGEENMGNKTPGGIYLPFGISAGGEGVYLYNSQGFLLDSAAVPALEENISFGYMTDGVGERAELNRTPGATNNTAKVATLDSSIATVSHESGFYDVAFTLNVTVPEGYTVYYTLNCKEPNKHSAEFPEDGLRITDVTSTTNKYANLYQGIIDQTFESYTRSQLPTAPVDKCTVVRLIIYNEKGKKSDVITKSYFINYDNKTGYENVSVVSLVSDPDGLYGTNGIFTNSANWSKGSDATERGKEKATSFTYFKADKSYSFEQVVGMRLHGTSTRSQIQKSLTLFARSEYGNGSFEKAIVGTAEKCHSMVLRADGNSKIQEGFIQSLVSDRELSTCDYTPTVVFIDGEYAGVYNLYERVSDEYIEEYYGVDEDNVYIVKKGSEGNVDGALAAYNSFYSYLTGTDFSKASNYNTLCQKVDIQSLIELLCAQIYICNADFSFRQNIAVWRVIDPSLEDSSNPYADGRWRFVLYDLDISIGAWTPVENLPSLSTKAQLFHCDATYNGFTESSIWADAGNGIINLSPVVALMRNSSFRQSFVLTFQDMVNVDFEADATLKKLNAALDIYQPLMKKHYERYGVPVKAFEKGSTNSNYVVKTYFGGTSAYAAVTGYSWRQEMQFAVDFFRDHGAYALEDLAEVFGLRGKLSTVSLAVNGEGGSLVLNGETDVPLNSEGEWSGSYYTDYAPTVTAVAAEGYTFTGWVITGNATLESTTSSTAVIGSFSGDFTLIATFAPVNP